MVTLKPMAQVVNVAFPELIFQTCQAMLANVYKGLLKLPSFTQALRLCCQKSIP